MHLWSARSRLFGALSACDPTPTELSCIGSNPSMEKVLLSSNACTLDG